MDQESPWTFSATIDQESPWTFSATMDQESHLKVYAIKNIRE